MSGPARSTELAPTIDAPRSSEGGASRWRPAIPLQPVLVLSHLLTLALPLAVLIMTGAWSHDLLHQRQQELARQAQLVAMMVDDQLRARTRPGVTGAPAGTAPLMEPEGVGPVVSGPEPTDVGRGRIPPNAPPPRSLPAGNGALAAIGPALTPTLVRVFHATHAGVRVLDARGVVVATSGPRLGDTMLDRREVVSALHGVASIAVRTEQPPTLIEPPADTRATRPLSWAVAVVPVYEGDDEVIGAVLLTRPTRGVGDALADMGEDLGAGAAVALALTLLLAMGFGWRLSRSLRALARVAHDMGEGSWWLEARGGTRGPPSITRALSDLAATRVAEVRAVVLAFEALSRRLAERLRYNEEFAGNVAHEFKTPLATLRGTIDLLGDDVDMPVAQRALFLENARVDLDRLDRMVTGLLDLARAEAGGAHDPVALDDVLDAIGWRYPDVEVVGGGGTVRGDHAQIELAVTNLVENARLHGGPPITLTGWVRGGEAGIDVEDHGPGISPANLPRVYDRFFTTSAGRTGTGLGLALVRAVAVAHGGEVSVESRPGWTRFRVTFGPVLAG